jgi:hypothetical protein
MSLSFLHFGLFRCGNLNPPEGDPHGAVVKRAVNNNVLGLLRTPVPSFLAPLASLVPSSSLPPSLRRLVIARAHARVLSLSLSSCLALVALCHMINSWSRAAAACLAACAVELHQTVKDVEHQKALQNSRSQAREMELLESLSAAREESARYAEQERVLRSELEEMRRKTADYADMLQRIVEELESEKEASRQAVAAKDEGWEQFESAMEILKALRLEIAAAELEGVANYQSVCSLPINSSHTLCGVSIEELVSRGNKTWNGVAAEAVRLSTLQYWITWETRTVPAATQQGYTGTCREGARDYLMRRLSEAGEVDVMTINPLYLHASGEGGPPRFLGRMSEPAKVMKSQVAWDRLSSQQQKTHWLGSKVRKSVKGKIQMLPVYAVFPYLILDAHTNWEVKGIQLSGPSKGAKVRGLV